MIMIENEHVTGFEAAIRGMRNPLESWEKSDTHLHDGACYICEHEEMPSCKNHVRVGNWCMALGENDLSLMKRLRKAGSDHAKYLRMINVTADITAPFYWWKEYDTYKVGTVANSCSTMHCIHKKEFTLDDFSHDHLIGEGLKILCEFIRLLNEARDSYINFDEYFAKGELNEEITCKKDVWWQMIQLLPSSYNQTRTIQTNYAVLLAQYHARKDHKLDEWRDYCAWVETLPCFKEICLDD